MSDQTLVELLYGSGSHVNTLACIEDIPLELAGRSTSNSPHSIWQLVWHMNFWMAYELKRVDRGDPPYPEHASESWPVETAPRTGEEWTKAIADFRRFLAELARLAESSPDALASEVPATHPDHTKRSSSLRAVLWQTLVHNSYHIGQVAMIRRSFGLWPPGGGGDSW